MGVLKMCTLSSITASCPAQEATNGSETRRNPAAAPDAPSPSYACPFLRLCAARMQAKLRDRQLTILAKDESDRRGTAFTNACRRPKHLLVVERVDLLLRDKHDKMD